MEIECCKEFLMDTARTLLTTDSPSGFTANAVAAAEKIAADLGYAAPTRAG